MTLAPFGYVLGVQSELAIVEGRLLVRAVPRWAADMPPEVLGTMWDEEHVAIDPYAPKRLLYEAWLVLHSAGIARYSGGRSECGRPLWILRVAK